MDILLRVRYRLCAACAIACSTSISAWCDTRAFGANGCGGPQRGCCGSCCSASFNEDSFDAEERKRAEREAKAKTKAVSEQPKQVEGMHIHAGDAPPPNSKEAQTQSLEKEVSAGPEAPSADPESRGADPETIGGPLEPRAEMEEGRESGVRP